MKGKGREGKHCFCDRRQSRTVYKTFFFWSFSPVEFHTDEINIDPEEEQAPLPPLLKESDITDKMLRKPTKFEIMRRFKSRRSKRKSQILHPTHLTEVRDIWVYLVRATIQMKVRRRTDPYHEASILDLNRGWTNINNTRAIFRMHDLF